MRVTPPARLDAAAFYRDHFSLLPSPPRTRYSRFDRRHQRHPRQGADHKGHIATAGLPLRSIAAPTARLRARLELHCASAPLPSPRALQAGPGRHPPPPCKESSCEPLRNRDPSSRRRAACRGTLPVRHEQKRRWHASRDAAAAFAATIPVGAGDVPPPLLESREPPLPTPASGVASGAPGA